MEKSRGSHGTLNHQKTPKKVKNKQVMLNTHLSSCFNVYICASFYHNSFLEGPHIVHRKDKSKYSNTLEKEHSQEL